jgi:small subunit ribosomal protein S8
MTDPITDMLNRIRNAQAANLVTVDAPFSKFKNEILKIFEKKGFISKFEKKDKKARNVLEITLKYDGKEGAVSGMRKVSKPGQRIYKDHFAINKVRGGFGLSVVSTSKGLMTDAQARKEKLGGEIILEIW